MKEEILSKTKWQVECISKWEKIIERIMVHRTYRTHLKLCYTFIMINNHFPCFTISYLLTCWCELKDKYKATMERCFIILKQNYILEFRKAHPHKYWLNMLITANNTWYKICEAVSIPCRHSELIDANQDIFNNSKKVQANFIPSIPTNYIFPLYFEDI